MKTLCFALVLLLFTVYCCDATPGLLAIQPDACCFDFSTVKVPPKFVTNITKTHSFCLNKAFIVQTVRGKQICYEQTFQWALNLYSRLHNTDSRTQKN